MPSISGVQRKLAILATLAIAVAFVVGKPGISGIVLGAGLVASSLWMYAAIFGVVLRSGRPVLALGLTFVKLAAFLALGWWSMSQGAGVIDPLGVGVGITCLPLAASWEALTARKR